MMFKRRTRGIKLRGARVLITGAGSGIGRLMALDAARRGAAEVIIWDLSEESAEAVRAQVAARGCAASTHIVNVADRDAVYSAAVDCGPIDVLINCAGAVTGKYLMDTTDEAIIRTFQINTLALYWTTRAFLPAMVERDLGMIVNVASAAGILGVAKQTDYSASKFAAFGFTESLRSELRARGSHAGTLVVAPYYIDTGMFEGVTTKLPHLLPILKEGDVARQIVDAVESGREQLVMPPFARLLPAVRLLPVPLFDKVMDAAGVNQTMDHFTGRGEEDA